MRECTLIFLYKPAEKEILLGMKKRRFGEGKWNGVGGKLEEGESIEASAVRETKEEIGVDIDEKHLDKVATIRFFFEDNKDWDQVAHVFFIKTWQGEPMETEEIGPKWHDIRSLPFESMWIDDPHWLPRVLRGEKLEATFTFDESGSKIIDMEVIKC